MAPHSLLQPLHGRAAKTGSRVKFSPHLLSPSCDNSQNDTSESCATIQDNVSTRSLKTPIVLTKGTKDMYTAAPTDLYLQRGNKTKPFPKRSSSKIQLGGAYGRTEDFEPNHSSSYDIEENKTNPQNEERARQACCQLIRYALDVGERPDKDVLYALPGSDAQCMVDCLDEASDKSSVETSVLTLGTQLLLKETITSGQRKLLMKLLAETSGSARCFPARLRHKGVDRNQRQLMFLGGTGTIYRGISRGQTVCVKAIRAYHATEATTLPALGRELALWAQIDHPNALRIHGAYMSDEVMKGGICIVSSWVNYGDLRHFLEEFPDISRAPLISDMISGLNYLHEVDIVHSNLKATNVLVSNDMRAMITDFGITHILQSSSNTNTGFKGSPHWLAPELLLEDDALPTKASDIWSLACTCFEALTGKNPFYELPLASQVVIALFQHQHPSRPPGVESDPVEEAIWELLGRCWKFDPHARPTVGEIQFLMMQIDFTDGRPPLDKNSGSRQFWEATRPAQPSTGDVNSVHDILKVSQVVSRFDIYE